MSEFPTSQHIRSLEAEEARLTPRQHMIARWFVFLAIALGGYAINGKGFAYLGYPPAYIGEILLISGLIVLLCGGYLRELLESPLSYVLLAFCAWGAIRTIPFLGTYGIEAVRDAAVWGYVLFMFVVGGLVLAAPRELVLLLRRFDSAIAWILGGLLLVNVVYRGIALPLDWNWPWSGTLIVHQKEGDVMVHTAGILLFWTTVFSRRPSWWLITLWALNTAVNAVLDRAGILSVAAALGLCILARSASTIPWRITLVGIFALMLLWATNMSIELPMGKGREISFEQILSNLESTVTSSGQEGLDGTKEWRLDWWQSIIDYTIHGEYFWTGKGFGINLADDDGFKVDGESKLRSPHNIHMTILARMGVPGVVLWALAVLGWGGGMVTHYLRAELRGRRRWADLFLFVGGYWLAMLINAAFDVALEGPMMAIWFWSLYGIGIAAMWLHAHQPELLDPSTDEPAREDQLAPDRMAIPTA